MLGQSTLKSDYLESMGIEQWYPRVHLANARVPMQINAVEESLVQEEVEVESRSQIFDQNPRVEIDTNKGQAKDEALDVNVESLQPLVKTSAADKSDNASVIEDEPIKFGLAFYIVNEYIVASSLVSNYVDYQDSSWRLLQNILKSLNSDKGELIHHHIISWPFFSSSQAAQGTEAAKQYVNSVLKHLLEEHQCKTLVSFGGVLPKLNSWDINQKDGFGISLVMLPSLYKMLNEPALKQKCWNIIKQSGMI